jgi:mono/diheme cytochrome c family protein
VTENPVPITMEVLERGQQRYEIFCSMCHGLIRRRPRDHHDRRYGYTPAPTFHDDRLRGESDGYLYDVITNGVRNMPGYGKQIPVADRWAIVAYTRALQRSQDATLADVPEDRRGTLARGRGAGTRR